MPRGISCLCLAGLILQFFLLQKCMALDVTNATTKLAYNNTSIKADLDTLRHIGQSLTRCLSISERWKCIEMYLTKVLDAVAQDNSTWRYGDYIVIEKLKKNRSIETKGCDDTYFYKQRAQRQHSLHDSENSGIAKSFLRLAETRAIRLRFPSSRKALQKLGAGISDAIDILTLENIAPSEALYGETEAAQANEGTHRSLNGFVDDKLEELVTKIIQNNNHLQNLQKTNKQKDYEQLKKIKYNKDKDKYSTKFLTNKNYKSKNKPFLFNNKKTSLKGRKKKNKDKNVAMMGGVALIAMVAQMFLSKVILIAGAAFVMAKIALLVSVLGSLKKESIGGSTSTDHIVVTHDQALSGHGGYGGHSVHGGHGGDDYHHDGGWHRSMPHIYHSNKVITAEPENHDEHNQKPPELHTESINHLNHGYGIHEIAEVNSDGDDYRRRHTQSGFI